MKVGVLQFFSWPERRVRARNGLRPRARAHRDHGPHRLRRGVARRAPFHQLQRLPVGAHDGHAGGGAHQAAAHRHRRVAGAVLPSAAPGRGGGAARRAVGRAGQLGRRARLRAGRVREFRGAGRGEHLALSRGGRDRAARPGPRSGSASPASISGSTGSRSCRSRCSSRTRRCGWRRPRNPRSTGRPGAASRS